VDLGLAMQLTNIIRDVREDFDMGRVYLPQDEMARFGYSEEDLKNSVRNQAFLDLMNFQSKRAREYFDRGFKLLAAVTGLPCCFGSALLQGLGPDRIVGIRRFGVSSFLEQG